LTIAPKFKIGIAVKSSEFLFLKRVIVGAQNMENTKMDRKAWLSGSVGFVAGVATTLVTGALLMGGMMGMMGGGFCDRPNALQRPAAQSASQPE
jgi:hypothetical protein